MKICDTDYEFHFTDGEVNGIVKVNATDTLKLFQDEIQKIDGIFINDKNERIKRIITKDDFLLQKGETLMSKYGFILDSVKGK